MDAPEVFESFRLYRVSGDGRNVPIYTRHVGIDSLYYARNLIINSRRVFLELPPGKGLEELEQDQYGRKLVNIWLQGNEV